MPRRILEQTSRYSFLSPRKKIMRNLWKKSGSNSKKKLLEKFLKWKPVHEYIKETLKISAVIADKCAYRILEEIS